MPHVLLTFTLETSSVDFVFLNGVTSDIALTLSFLNEGGFLVLIKSVFVCLFNRVIELLEVIYLLQSKKCSTFSSFRSTALCLQKTLVLWLFKKEIKLND